MARSASVNASIRSEADIGGAADVGMRTVWINRRDHTWPADLPPPDAESAAWLIARLIADDLSEVGITVDCAPVLDIPVPGADPIIGDRVYGTRRSGRGGVLLPFDRQALHAEEIRFAHPTTGKRVVIQAPIAPDIQELIRTLRQAGRTTAKSPASA